MILLFCNDSKKIITEYITLSVLIIKKFLTFCNSQSNQIYINILDTLDKNIGTITESVSIPVWIFETC